MLAIAGPVQHEHALTLQLLATTRGHKWWHRQMASGLRVKSVTGIVGVLNSTELAVSMHMDYLFENQPGDLNTLADMLFAYARRLLFEEGSFLMNYYHGLPGRFFAMRAEDDYDRRSAAGYISDLWAVVCQAEEQAAKTDRSTLRSWLKQAVWLNNTWCREICVSVQECGGVCAPEDINNELDEVSSGPLHSVPIERSFNFLRRQTDHSLSRHLGPATTWHRCWHNGLMQEMGFESVSASVQDGHDRPGGLAKPMFSAKARGPEFSLGQAVLDEWVAGGSWPSPCPTSFHRQFMINGCLLACSGDFRELANVYLSLLADGACAIVMATDVDSLRNRQVYLVLGACEYGVLTWLSSYYEIEGCDLAIVVPDSSIDNVGSMLQICITDVEQYMVIPLQGQALPLVLDEHPVPDDDRGKLGSIVLVARDAPTPLLTYAGMSAFRSMSSHFLSKLVTHLECSYEPPKPTTVDELVMILLAHVFRMMSSKSREAILRQRCKPKATYDTVIDEQLGEMVADVLPDENERSLVRKVAKKMPVTADDLNGLTTEVHTDEPTLKSPAGTSRKPKSTSKPDGGAPAAGSSSSRASANRGTGGAAPGSVRVPPQTEPEPVRVPPQTEPDKEGLPKSKAIRSPPLPRLESRMYTAADAKQFCPPFPGSSISINAASRWEIKYKAKPAPPFSHSETWGGRDGVTHLQALALCLQWAWSVHSALGRGDCPWDLAFGDPA